MAMKFVGSICLSDIPKSEIKMVQCKDGVTRAFLNISVHENATPRYTDENGKKRLLSDHFISCAPRKEDRKEDVNYLIGNLRTWTPSGNEMPSAEEIANAPSAEVTGTDLPF